MTCAVEFPFEGNTRWFASYNASFEVEPSGLNTIPSYLHMISSSKKPTRDFILVVTLYLDSQFELWYLRLWHAMVGYLCEQGYSKENATWNFANIVSYFLFWECWPDIIVRRDDFAFFWANRKKILMELRLVDTVHQRILSRTLLLAAGPREKEKKAQDLTLSLAPFPFLSSSRREPSS